MITNILNTDENLLKFQLQGARRVWLTFLFSKGPTWIHQTLSIISQCSCSSCSEIVATSSQSAPLTPLDHHSIKMTLQRIYSDLLLVDDDEVKALRMIDLTNEFIYSRSRHLLSELQQMFSIDVTTIACGLFWPVKATEQYTSMLVIHLIACWLFALFHRVQFWDPAVHTYTADVSDLAARLESMFMPSTMHQHTCLK